MYLSQMSSVLMTGSCISTLKNPWNGSSRSAMIHVLVCKSGMGTSRVTDRAQSLWSNRVTLVALGGVWGTAAAGSAWSDCVRAYRIEMENAVTAAAHARGPGDGEKGQGSVFMATETSLIETIPPLTDHHKHNENVESAEKGGAARVQRMISSEYEPVRIRSTAANVMNDNDSMKIHWLMVMRRPLSACLVSQTTPATTHTQSVRSAMIAHNNVRACCGAGPGTGMVRSAPISPTRLWECAH